MRKLLEQLTLIMLLAGVLLIQFGRPYSLEAQEEDQYTGLDVVFLVDQSGSMGGCYGHPEANDSQQLRFKGAQLAMEWLGSYRLSYLKGSSVNFRTAVVYFGSTAQTVIEPTVVDPESAEQWDALEKVLKDPLAPEEFPKHLDNTHFIEAFKVAKQMFSAMEAEDSSRRVKGIVVLTDGEPFAAVAPYYKPPTDEQEEDFDLEAYVEDMIEYVGNAFPHPEYQIYVVALNDREGDTWSGIRKTWEQITHGHAQLVENNNVMAAYFQEILQELVKPLEVEDGEEIIIVGDVVPVPPYLAQIKLFIHKPLPGSRVKVYVDPEYKELLTEGALTKVEGEDEPIEVITVENPQPGYWYLKRPETAVIHRIFVRYVYAKALAPEPKTPVPQYLVSQVRFQFEGSGGRPLPKYKDEKYALQAKALVTNADGSWAVELDLSELSAAEAGISVYGACFLPTRPGVHYVYLEATSRDPEGNPLPIIERGEVTGTFPVFGTDFVFHPPVKTLTQLVPVWIEADWVEQASPAKKVPDPIEPQYLPQVEATLTVKGKATTISLQRQADGSYRGEFLPVQSAPHVVHLTARVPDPAQGDKLQTVFDQDVGKLEVLPALADWTPLARPPAQYKSVDLKVQLTDQAGQPLRDTLAQDYQLDAEATVRAGGQTWDLPLKAQADSTWAAEFTPEVTGEHTVHLTVKALDGAGHEITLLDEDSLEFPVGRTTVLADWAPLAEPPAQYKSVDLQVQLTDQAGQPLRDTLAQDYRLDAEATVSADGQTWYLPLKAQADSTWTAEFTPEVTGKHTVHLTVRALDGAGHEITLLDEDSLEFPVDRTTIVSYAIVAPEDGAEHEWRDWRFGPRSFVVEVELQDIETGERITPTDVAMITSGGTVFSMTVAGPGGRDYSEHLQFLPAKEAGRYLASTESLNEVGVYEIEVVPIARLKPHHLYDEPSRRVRVKLIENHILAVLFTAAPPAGALLALALMAFVGWQVYLRWWKADGTLTIEGESGLPIQSFNLKSYGKHRLKFGQKQLLAGTRLRRLEVQQPRDQQYILVTAISDVGRFKVLDKDMFTSGARMPLDEGIWIVYERGGLPPW